MLWFFILIIAVTLGAVITAGFLAPNRKYAMRVIGVIMALALLILVTPFIWQHALVAVAIGAACSLAVGVMFGRVKPSRAIAGALTAFVLMFVFSWLALQMSDPLLFGRDSDLSRWLKDLFNGHRPFGSSDIGTSGFLVALGISSLIAACFLERWMKAIAVFFGLLMVLFFTPAVLEGYGICLQNMFYGHDRVLIVAVIGVIVIGIVSIVRLLANSNNSKNT